MLAELDVLSQLIAGRASDATTIANCLPAASSLQTNSGKMLLANNLISLRFPAVNDETIIHMNIEA